jgi:hypothetical protein
VQADLAAARALIEGGPGAAQGVDVGEGVSLVRKMRSDVEALEAAAGPFLGLAPHLGWVPAYGATIEAAPTLLDMAIDLTAAGEMMVDPLMPVLSEADGDGTSNSVALMAQAVTILAESRSQFEEALGVIQEARAEREQLDVEAFHPRVRGWMEQLDRVLPLAEEGARAALVAPELLGAEGPRTYLLLVQNEDELRATGGFISGVTEVRVEGGRVASMAFEDSYVIDDFSRPYPDPPTPLRELMLADLWVFRDSNWSPDFPTAARKAIELYMISRDDAEVDGVIALDQRAISLLLGPLSPLTIEGVDRPVTGQNVLEVARQAWAPGGSADADWWRNRKDVMADVLDATMEKVQRGVTWEQVVGLGYAAHRALEEKHLLVYLEDQEAAEMVRTLGWDGALARSPGDYLMVVDTNMGFNKVNAVVEERVAYAVDLRDPAQPRATLTVHHRHPVEDWSGPCSQESRYDATYEGMTRRCYYDYVRVYARPGAELLGATPHPVPGSILLSGERQRGVVDIAEGELGKAVFATFLVMRPGEQLETTFSYALPEATLEQTEGGWRYRLVVQKQPGTDARPLAATLELPAGARVVSADPPPSERVGGRLVYALALRTDLTLDVTWRRGGRD